MTSFIAPTAGSSPSPTSGLFLLTSNKDGGVSLFSMDAKEDDAEFTSGSSPDNNLHYIIAQGKHRKEKGEILQGALVDRKGNKIVAFSYTTPEDRDDFKHLDVVLSNDGIIDLVYNVAVKPGKDDYTPFKYTIVQVDLRGRPTAIPLSSLPEGDFRNIAWSLDKHGRLLFTGFLSAKKKTGFTALMSGSFDPITKKLGALSQTDITPLLTNQPDGSRALVLEDNSDKVYQSYYGPAYNPIPYNPTMGSMGYNAAMHASMTTTSSVSVVYQNRGNNYIVKLDQNNIPQWINLVSKNQKEPDIALAVGTAYFLAIKTKKAFTQTHLLNHAKFHLGEVSVGGGAWQALTATSPQSN